MASEKLTTIEEDWIHRCEIPDGHPLKRIFIEDGTWDQIREWADKLDVKL